MDHSYEYNSGPITKGGEEIGYFFEESKAVKIGDETLYSDSRWELFPDGTFTCDTQRSWESWDIPQEGVFERSRYEEFVNQMKVLKTDWKDQLTYIPFDYEFSEGLAKYINKDGKWGFMDEQGRLLIPCVYDNAGKFHEGLAGVQRNKKWGYVDKTGSLVIQCIYDDGGDFHEGLAGVQRNKKWGYVDNTGQEVIPCIYDEVDDFHESLARVKRNNKWGYVDKTGKEVIACIYDEAGDFHEGLARVERNKKWGYIDNTGREVVPCQYEDAIDFDDREKAWVKENSEWVLIDKTGQKVVEKKTPPAQSSASNDELPF